MLNKIEITNFKAFGETQQIEFKPITLLYGPNSAGKSSIIKSLLLTKQSIENNDNSNSVLLPKSKFTDLGNYQEMVHKHDTNKIITFKYEYETIDRKIYRRLGVGWIKKIGYEISFEYVGEKIGIQNINIYLNDAYTPGINFEKVDIQSIKDIDEYMYDRGMQGVDIDKKTLFKISEIGCIEQIIDVYKRYTGDEVQRDEIKKLIKKELKSKYYVLQSFMFIGTIDKGGNRREYYNNGNDREMIRKMEYIRSIIDIPRFCSYILEEIFGGLVYLGPLRQFPVRHNIFSGITPKGVGLKGENTDDMLFLDSKLVERVNNWMDIFEIGYKLSVTVHSDNSISDLYSIRLYDDSMGIEVSTVDVGFEISQVLPIIVQSLVSQKNIICIEQPEIHLHPKHQTTLANLFVEGVARGNQFIIETHSEHLILRLQNLIREGKIRAEDVSVNYIDKEIDGSYCLQLRLNEKGDFIDPWPNGFFEEGYKEVIFRC